MVYVCYAPMCVSYVDPTKNSSSVNAMYVKFWTLRCLKNKLWSCFELE